MLKQVCLFLLLCGQSVISTGYQDDLVNEIYTALERVLQYVSENRQEMNLDGLFGIVLVEVQLESLEKNMFNRTNMERLNKVRMQAAKILQNVDFSKMKLTHNKQIFLKYLLDTNIWKKNATFTTGRLLNNTPALIPNFSLKICSNYRNYLSDNYFSEGVSDQCLVELIESSIVSPKNCHIGKTCSSYMVDDNRYTPGYGITHKLLYLQVAESRSCSWNKKWLDQKKKEYCSNILGEAQTNSYCGFISELDDLFLEQIVLCGYEGFAEFLHKSWIKHVLKIQTEYGCFGINVDNDSHSNELKRRKRESNVIKYGCMDHTTGLGAAVLSLYLNFLLTSSGSH